MEFGNWFTPFESGEVWLIDLSWGTKEWTLEKAEGIKYTIPGSDKHKSNELILRVFHEDSETIYEISYESVNGYRCLDEHGLTEIWNGNPPKSNTFKIKGHGWSQESPLTFFMGNSDEWSHLIVTKDECLEVICQNTPTIKTVGKVAPVKTAT